MSSNWYILIGMAVVFCVAAFFLFRYFKRLVRPNDSTGRLIVYIVIAQVIFWSIMFTLFYTYINLFPDHTVL